MPICHRGRGQAAAGAGEVEGDGAVWDWGCPRAALAPRRPRPRDGDGMGTPAPGELGWWERAGEAMGWVLMRGSEGTQGFWGAEQVLRGGREGFGSLLGRGDSVVLWASMLE